jgi:hypothetical protein
MKKLVNTISPYILLLIPIFIGLLVLLFNPSGDALENSVELHASFFKVPQMNLFEVIAGLFKCPFK